MAEHLDEVDVEDGVPVGGTGKVPTLGPIRAELQALNERLGPVLDAPDDHTLLEWQKEVNDSLSAMQATLNDVLTELQDGSVDQPLNFTIADLDEAPVEVKDEAGAIAWLVVLNPTNAPLWLKVFNAEAANVTLGSTEPVLNFMIPTVGTTNGAGVAIPLPLGGTSFDTGISVASTASGELLDDTAPPGAGLNVNGGYI